MGKQHCKNYDAAKAFIKGLRKSSEKSKAYKNRNIKKKKNCDGSYLVTWTVYTRV